jgi:hypothetical protein
MAGESKRVHTYHAEATVLSGNLTLPLEQEIKPQAYAKLPGEGGYLSQRPCSYRLEGVISVGSAYTQVGGNPDPKPGHGWSTLCTSVVEDLNVMDVVTADRVVAQISTEHPLEGYVPTVTFLGTRFENLRIAGHPVKLDLDPNILGAKPASDAPYTSDPGFISRVSSQYQRIASQQNVPADLAERYNRLPSTSENQESIECSLVHHADGSYPGRSFGHVIDVPNFGRIHLAVLRLEHSEYEKGVPKQTLFNLTMMKLHMGCVAAGKVALANSKTNGGTQP